MNFCSSCSRMSCTMPTSAFILEAITLVRVRAGVRVRVGVRARVRARPSPW